MRVLITGGAGFIGSNLARALAQRGDSVVVLDDLSTGLVSNLDGIEVTLIEGTIVDAATVAGAIEGADAVVHLAARGSVPRSIEDPAATHDVNATGTLRVLEAARAAGAHVVFSSSSSVYGVNTALPKAEEMWTQPMSPYGASKLAAESYAMAFRQVYGLDVLALRFFNVYGPLQRPDHDYAAVIPKFAWLARAGQPLTVHGDGEQTRDFTHVDSVVAVLASALDRRLSWDRPVNLAFGAAITVNGVVAELERQLGADLAIVHEPARAADVRNSLNDPALLRTLFPDVAPVDFSSGLATVLAWMAQLPTG
ncbi:MAG: NAD-dependent epimerase/dehydratase family protein [Candidatus Nanopelagicales bacterium]|nr:NAD-dependent epimerase/dehydratase family protein [Candidatus Nanopelagicales bacterium]